MSHQEQAAQLYAALQRLTRALPTTSAGDSVLGEMPLLQVRSLCLIAGLEDLRVGDVACRLGISLPSASRAVDRLVRQGLVARRTDDQDRRAVRLRVTPTAHVLLDEKDAEWVSRLDTCLQTMQDAEASDIILSLHRLSAAAEAMAELSSAAPPTAEEHGRPKR